MVVRVPSQMGVQGTSHGSCASTKSCPMATAEIQMTEKLQINHARSMQERAKILVLPGHQVKWPHSALTYIYIYVRQNAKHTVHVPHFKSCCLHVKTSACLPVLEQVTAKHLIQDDFYMHLARILNTSCTSATSRAVHFPGRAP